MFSRSSKGAARPANGATALSIVGGNCSLTGDIVSEGEVHVDGRVDGDVRCKTLVIGESGAVTGEISAERVRVLGSVTGQISAGAVELAHSARVVGDISHDSLAVEAGAYVEGRFNRLPAAAPMPPAKAAEEAAAAPAAGEAVLVGS